MQFLIELVQDKNSFNEFTKEIMNSQDAIGTYYCITFDYDSLNDQKVTIRNRDTMQQERIEIKQIFNYLNNINK